jgi:hypothetical protein
MKEMNKEHKDILKSRKANARVNDSEEGESEDLD